MNRFLMSLVLTAFVSLSGCDNTQDVDAGGEAPEVETPTTESDPDVHDKGGLSVKLPGVEINVDEEKGVEVKAPGSRAAPPTSRATSRASS